MRKYGVKFILCICLLTMLSCGTVFAEEESKEVSDEFAQYYVSLIPSHGNVYYVNQDGTGDFISIQQGVNEVENNDVLIIYPGTYTENVEIIGKTVHLIGIDMDECVLTSNAKNYFQIPLTLGAGVVANMTIYGYDAGYNEDIYYELQSVDDIYVRRANEFPGYSIHVDTDYSKDKELKFLHCKIISDTNCCIGIGTRPGNHIVIDQCEFVTEKNAGGIFYHNSRQMGDSVLTVSNTSFTMNIPMNAFIMQSVSDVNEVTLQFERVKVYDLNNKEYCDVEIQTEEEFTIENNPSEEEFTETEERDDNAWNGLEAFRLDPVSKNNSISSMNG